MGLELVIDSLSVPRIELTTPKLKALDEQMRKEFKVLAVKGDPDRGEYFVRWD